MKEIRYRQLHLDFHTSPLIENIGEKFDKTMFINNLKAAKVNSINIFAKCHHGLSYYPTKLGRMHPHLKFDLLGEMIQACREADITAPIYFTTGWEEVSAERADWLEVNAQGQIGDVDPFDNSYYKWRKLCHNKPTYVQSIKDQVDEIIDMYGEVDGLWFDIVVQHQCVCPECQASMKSLNLDPQIEDDRLKHDHIVVTKFMKEMFDHVKGRLPESLVYFNGPFGPDNGMNGYSIDQKIESLTHLEIESLPSDRWGYNHFPLFVNYHNHRDIELIGMNGKFHTAWGDFGSLRNKEAMSYECYRMLANGTKLCIGDQLHPNGMMDEIVYKRIGEIYTEIEKREAYCENTKKLSQIGVISSNEGAFERYKSDEGLMRMMLELHRPFDFIHVHDDFNRYKVIVLPDHVKLDDASRDKLDAYMKNGGKIIATHHSGLNLTEMPVEFISDNPFEPSYMRFNEGVSDEYENYDLVIYQRGSIVKASSGEVLAKVGEPYFNRTHDTYCSHRQAPFKALTEHPAVVAWDTGYYIAYPIFEDYMTYGSKLLRDLLEMALEALIDEPLVKSNLPTTAEITIRSQDKKKILHVLHYVAQKKCEHIEIVDTMIPLHQSNFVVKHHEKPSKVYMVPENKDIEFNYLDGYVAFTVDKIEGYGIIVIE